MVNHDDVMAALRRCYDPCCKDRAISVVDMGLIENVRVEADRVAIDMLLTTGWCPFVARLNEMMVDEVGRVEGVAEVQVEVLWDPVWTMDRLSESARTKLTLPLEPLIPYREARIEREKALAAAPGGTHDRR